MLEKQEVGGHAARKGTSKRAAPDEHAFPPCTLSNGLVAVLFNGGLHGYRPGFLK